MAERASTKVNFLSDLTMAHAEDRTASWRAMRAAGEVWEISPGLWMLTSAEAVQFAHRNPALFSNVGVMHIHDPATGRPKTERKTSVG